MLSKKESSESSWAESGRIVCLSWTKSEVAKIHAKNRAKNIILGLKLNKNLWLY